MTEGVTWRLVPKPPPAILKDAYLTQVLTVGELTIRTFLTKSGRFYTSIHNRNNGHTTWRALRKPARPRNQREWDFVSEPDDREVVG